MKQFKVIFHHKTNSNVTAIDEPTAWKEIKQKYGTDKFYLELINDKDTSEPNSVSEPK